MKEEERARTSNRIESRSSSFLPSFLLNVQHPAFQETLPSSRHPLGHSSTLLCSYSSQECPRIPSTPPLFRACPQPSADHLPQQDSVSSSLSRVYTLQKGLRNADSLLLLSSTYLPRLSFETSNEAHLPSTTSASSFVSSQKSRLFSYSLDTAHSETNSTKSTSETKL